MLCRWLLFVCLCACPYVIPSVSPSGSQSISQSASAVHRLIDCIVDKKLPYNTYQHLDTRGKVEKCFAFADRKSIGLAKKSCNKNNNNKNLPTYFLVDSNLILSPCYFLHVPRECNRPKTCKCLPPGRWGELQVEFSGAGFEIFWLVWVGYIVSMRSVLHACGQYLKIRFKYLIYFGTGRNFCNYSKLYWGI